MDKSPNRNKAAAIQDTAHIRHLILILT